MGHGDTLALTDANFPGASTAQRYHPLPGTDLPAILEALLELFPIDTFEPMAAVGMAQVGDETALSGPMQDAAALLEPHGHEIALIDRFDFYDAAKASYALIQTGEPRFYGNLVLRKGVIAT